MPARDRAPLFARARPAHAAADDRPAATRRRRRRDPGGIERLAPFDVATIIVPRGEPDVVERARLLALKQPGRVALFPGVDATDERLARGAADAILLGDDHDRIGRAAGLALLYGTLPIAPEVGSEPRLPGRLRRGLAHGPRHPVQHARRRSRSRAPFAAPLTLRADGDVWTPLVKTLMTSAPRWSARRRRRSAEIAAPVPGRASDAVYRFARRVTRTPSSPSMSTISPSAQTSPPTRSEIPVRPAPSASTAPGAETEQLVAPQRDSPELRDHLDRRRAPARSSHPYSNQKRSCSSPRSSAARTRPASSP